MVVVNGLTGERVNGLTGERVDGLTGKYAIYHLLYESQNGEKLKCLTNLPVNPLTCQPVILLPCYPITSSTRKNYFGLRTLTACACACNPSASAMVMMVEARDCSPCCVSS